MVEIIKKMKIILKVPDKGAMQQRSNKNAIDYIM